VCVSITTIAHAAIGPHRAPGIPCALIGEAERKGQTSRGIRGEIAKVCFSASARTHHTLPPVIVRGRRTIQYSRGANDGPRSRRVLDTPLYRGVMTTAFRCGICAGPSAIALLPSSRIIAAPLSAIIAVGVLVFPEVIVGITEASATAEAGDAVKAQRSSTTAERFAGRAHLRGADGMEDGGADIAGGLGQRGVVVADEGPGRYSLGMIRARAPSVSSAAAWCGWHRRRPGGPRRSRGNSAPIAGAWRAGGADADGAARAGRLQIAGADVMAGSDAGDANLSSERLHWNWMLARSRWGSERVKIPSCDVRHGQGPAAAERVVEAHQPRRTSE